MKILYCSVGKLCLYISYIVLLYFLLCAWRPARGQTPYTLQGQVLSAENQEPLAGASVLLRGTTNGTSTDKNGYFSVTASEKETRLFLSFIGYRSLDTLLVLPLKKELVLILQQDLTMLEEVKVSMGYWETSKKLSTGNISKVTEQTIEKQPVSNPIQALSGRMPGVFVQQQSGVAGGGIKIRIRGANSIASGNEPLYVVDGVPYASASLMSGQMNSIMSGGSPLSAINPSEIASIEVLKDADATSIYGSRGSNGVVLITTKKGKAGTTRFNLTADRGASTVTHRMKLLNTSQYLEMRNEAYRNDSKVPTAGSNGYDLLQYDTTRYTDWQKKLIGGTAFRTNVQASLSGGSKNTNFVLGAGYYKEGTVFPGDFSYRKTTGHFTISHQSEDGRFGLSASLSYQLERQRIFSGDITWNSLQLLPNAPDIYDKEGKLNWGPYTFNNPYAYLIRKYKSNTHNLITSVVASYKISPGLVLRSSMGYTAMQMGENSSVPVASFNPQTGILTGSANFGNGSLESWIIEPQLEYKKTFRRSDMTFLAGSTFQQNRFDKQTLAAAGFTSDTQLENIRAASSVNVTETVNTQYKYNAVYGRLNYVGNEKFLLNLTARRDGSSRFGPDNRFANFWAVGGGYIFSNENGIRSQWPALSFGKLRASFGTSGNDQISDYGYLDSYSAGSYAYNGMAVYIPTRLANPGYGWETNRKLEAALELGFFSNRILAEFSFFRNRSSSQLVGYPLPATTGFTTIQYNLPAKVQNKGVEFEMSAVITENRKLNWSVSFNMTVSATKLISYPNLQGSSYVNRYRIGEPLSLARVYKAQGVDPKTGTYRFLDVNGDGVISSAGDQKQFTALVPKFYGGVGSNLRMGGWQLDVFFQFVKQNGYNYNSSFGMPGTKNNQPVQVMERWQNQESSTAIQKFSQNVSGETYIPYTNNQSSSSAVGDASYIRLKNVSLSCQLPAVWTRAIKIPDLKLTLTGQNLLTFTRYSGLDPETQSFISLPSLRTISMGLKLTL
ncbi:SusC/RagA family TonB-linked outer membrane protein [Dyadobacter frigoris]|uniref:SusC/RagA family TonB-linked outer membrane protein n=1 Tax=Dyadobacter frigoris TaxID=2576211 RepID=A0A4U6CN46_9BACT|nr:SusC/RagA family TonB-linked outer membrane protein [Dyadobacter frigoris]TKT85496.1 SusC/RagA family TonB-linked outer membrane protein [Dyadobacter frigoris]GLU56227.1 SusC/RagA family TonB-linked outer membrane protein [Dyadobacter frigoris]